MNALRTLIAGLFARGENLTRPIYIARQVIIGLLLCNVAWRMLTLPFSASAADVVSGLVTIVACGVFAWVIAGDNDAYNFRLPAGC